MRLGLKLPLAQPDEALLATCGQGRVEQHATATDHRGVACMLRLWRR